MPSALILQKWACLVVSLGGVIWAAKLVLLTHRRRQTLIAVICDDEEARISVHRSTRYVWIVFLLQASVLAMSISALLVEEPSWPPAAVHYFTLSLWWRAALSGGMWLMTWLDVRDSRRLLLIDKGRNGG